MLVALSKHLDFIVEPVYDGLHRLPLLISSLPLVQKLLLFSLMELSQIRLKFCDLVAILSADLLLPLFVLSLTSDLPSHVILVLVSVLAVLGSQLGV